MIRVIDLYPWDAGTNSGMSYMDVGSETQPRESIHRITSCHPDDERSPFFDVTCAPIKPVARLPRPQICRRSAVIGGDAAPPASGDQ